jgi:hypothetical protein
MTQEPEAMEKQTKRMYYPYSWRQINHHHQGSGEQHQGIEETGQEIHSNRICSTQMDSYEINWNSYHTV